MAVSYDAWKKGYESLNDQEKQQYNDRLKSMWNDTYNQYMKQYQQAQQPQQTTQQSNFNNQNGTNWANRAQQQSIQQTANGDTNQNRAWVQKTVTPQEIQSSINDAQSKMQNQNYNFWEQRDNFIWSQKEALDADGRRIAALNWKYYDESTWRVVDNKPNVSPELDQSKFNQDPWKITVQEWTAQQTGRPDYQANSEARLNEMKGNLDHYFATSPRMFSDRDTFNRVFEYNTRESDAQRQLLDSYWKRKEDMDKASQYTSWESIMNWMNNAEITTDQLNLLKDTNPEAYQKRQELQEEEIKKRIVNSIVPPLLEEISQNMVNMMNNLWIQPQEAEDIEWVYNDTMDRTQAWQTMEDANRTVKRIEEVNNKRTAIMNRYASSTWWTVSDALAAARMQKALAPYDTEMQGLQYQYQDYANLFSQKQAAAYQAAQVRQMQASENQRIWNQRLTALWFATDAMSYRTPEQQAQLRLQEQQAQNEMQLLQQSRLNDLNRYNQYATAKLNNQLQQELTDLSVEDEAQLKANLYNALSWYYEQYGDIIQRSQSQAVDDIIAYAKKNGISVAQALTKNFIEPLHNKWEFKMAVRERYGLNKYQQEYAYTIDENWNVVIKASWYGEIPQDAFKTRAGRQEAYSDVYDTSLNRASYVTNLADCIKDGSYGWQCGAFVNDVLVAWDNNKVFGNSLQDKKNVMNVSKSEWPQVWYAAVFDLWYVSKDWINHWHVGIVTSVNNDWSIDVLESNWKSDETIHVKRYSKADVDKKVLWYYKPTNYDISRDLEQSDTKQRLLLQGKFSNNPTWNDNWYIESLSKDFEVYLENWKDAIPNDQWKALKQDYGMDEKDFREMAQIYAKTGLKKQWVDQAENALKSALQLKNMLETNKTLWIKDNPQKWLLDWAINQWIPRTDAGEAKAQFNTLSSQLKLNALFTAKDNGATFGAMSDAEWQVLWDSATNLKRNSSASTFEKNLNSLIAELSNVVSSGGWKLPQWVYNTDI